MAIADISQVVNVTVSLDTAPIPQQGFDTVMFLGEHKVFTERWKVYNTAADMLNDGFESTDPSYLAIATLSSGPNKPKIMMVGRREVDSLTYTPTVENLAVYTLELKVKSKAFEEFTFTSDADATATEIVNGLIADFTANATPALAAVVTLTNVADELEVTGTDEWAVRNVTSNLNPATASKVVTETIPEALAALKVADATWAYFGIESRLAVDVNAARDHAESTTEIFGFSTSGAEGKLPNGNSSLDDAYADLSQYSVGIWSADAAMYPEMGMLRPLATVQIPGQTTLHGQQLYGIAVDKDSTLTNSESLIVRGKNANTYELIGGVGFVRDGKVFSGEFVDNVDLARWFKARLQENVYQLVVSKARANTKVPYTNSGIAMVGDRIIEVVNQGINGGVFNGDFNNGLGYILELPALEEIPTNDRANRVLNGVKITVQTTGAIYTINIDGIITV
jgi:hypothetical protein